MVRACLKLVFALVAISLSTPTALAQGTHKDTRLGFELKPPRGWTQIPMRPDEEWLVAKFTGEVDRVVDDNNKRYFWTIEPELLVVAFPNDREKPKDEDEKYYRDYKSYMAETYGRGFFVEEEETKTHQGLPVTCLEIKVESNDGRPEQHIVTWVYETEVGAIAVHFDTLASEKAKHKSSIRRTLKSFKAIERTAPTEASASSGGLPSVPPALMTPEARKEYRIAEQRKEWELLADGLPKKEGWEATEIDGVLMLTHVDDKYTKSVAQRVRAIMDWLEEYFPSVGPDEYARAPLVRICEDESEKNRFREGTGTFWVDSYHLVTHKAPRAKAARGWNSSDNAWEWEYIGSRTLTVWFRERDAELWNAMPEWVREGLNLVAQSSTEKGSKLEFDEGDRERAGRKALPQSDDRMGLDRLMVMTQKEFDAMGRTTEFQAAAILRFFINSRSKKYRYILPLYVANVRTALDEFAAENPKPDADIEAEDEEAENKLIAEQRAWRLRRERSVLDRAFGLTFGDWDKGDWQSLERAFGRSL